MTADMSQNDIDFEQLAGLCGYRPRSAETMYKNARRKLLREFLNASDGAGSAPPLDSDPPNASQSGGSSSPADNGDEDDQGQPPKKVRKTYRASTLRTRKARRTLTSRKRKAGEKGVEGGGPSGSSVRSIRS